MQRIRKKVASFNEFLIGMQVNARDTSEVGGEMFQSIYARDATILRQFRTDGKNKFSIYLSWNVMKKQSINFLGVSTVSVILLRMQRNSKTYPCFNGFKVKMQLNTNIVLRKKFSMYLSQDATQRFRT